MKSFSKRFLIFFVFAFFSYCLLLLIWNFFPSSNINPNLNFSQGQGYFSYTRLREIEDFNGADVLVIGSSHAYRGFDPRIFKANGLKIFNLGSSAQTPLQSEILLNRYLYKIKPKVVLLEVYPGSLTADGVESSLDLISNLRTINLDVIHLVYKMKNIKLVNTLIIRLILDLFEIETKALEPKIKGKNNYISGGYVENYSLNSGTCQNTESGLAFNMEQIASLNRIEANLQEQNIKLIYVSAPVTSNFVAKHPEYELFYNFMKHKSNYLNFTQLENLDNEKNFFDCDHLNQFGVEIFNKKFLNFLRDSL